MLTQSVPPTKNQRDKALKQSQLTYKGGFTVHTALWPDNRLIIRLFYFAVLHLCCKFKIRVVLYYLSQLLKIII